MYAEANMGHPSRTKSGPAPYESKAVRFVEPAY
jgi:hypothetical protein